MADTHDKKHDKKADAQRGDAKKAPPAKGKGSGRAVESITFTLITLVALVLLNVAGYFVFFRFDLTKNRLYSLSQASQRLVAELDDDMEITAYFTSDLPPPFNATELYVRNILAEYEASSNGRLRVRFINPDDEDERQAAQRDGVQEVPHQLIENDSVSVRNGYRGLVIRYLGDRKVIPVIQDTRGLEYEITQAIRLLVREPLPVGVVEGHGSPSPTEGMNTLRSALEHYNLTTVDVSQEIDTNLRALLLVGPTEELTETQLRRINQYVMRGGSLGVFGGTMRIDIQGPAPTATQVQTGVNQLLERWGVEIGSSLVADARCGRVPMRTPIGIPIPVAYPPAPIVVFDQEAQEHPALFRIPQAPFFFTSPILVRDRFHELNGTVLARSSEDGSWLMSGTTIQLEPRDPREWRITQERGPHNVMVALSGTLPSAFDAAGEGEGSIAAPAQSEREVRILVAGSGAMLRDEFLPQEERARAGSGVALALNAVDWLAGDADLIAIRAKNVEDPALDVPQSLLSAREEAIAAAEEGDEAGVNQAIDRHNQAQQAWENKKLMYRLGITFGLPVIVMLFGLVRWQLRSNKRANLEELRKKLSAQKKTKKAA
ncbi:MAG: GldG family protein [Sandaracinaceae bacterium]|nr:GldG family protein [Sandaracinaceae bacterium]